MSSLQEKSFMKKLSLMIVCTLAINLLPGNIIRDKVYGQEVSTYNSSTVETIAEFIFTETFEGQVSATDGFKQEVSYFGLSDNRKATFSSGNGTIYANGWNGASDDVPKYWYINTSSKGYESLNLSYSAYGTNTSPKYFEVEYGASETGPFTVIRDYYLSNSSYNIGVNLPPEASDLEQLYIRIKVKEGSESISGGSISSGGNSRMKDVILTGTAIDTGVSAVKATPNSGPVKDGTEVSLSIDEEVVKAIRSVAISPRATTDSALEVPLTEDTIFYEAATTADAVANPTENSNVYDGTPITIDFGDVNTFKIKAFVKTVEGDSSVIKEFVYTKAKLKQAVITPDPTTISEDTEVSLSIDVEDADIYYNTSADGTEPEAPTILSTKYTEPFTIEPGTIITAIVVGDGYLDSDLKTFKFPSGILVPPEDKAYNDYYGQLHAHSNASDGDGTVLEAFTYARDTAGLDYFALTDHSNSFDTASSSDKAGTYNLGAYNANNEVWSESKSIASESTTENFTGLLGYEMTWSGGPGHINTFFTDGFVSRKNSELNTKSNDAGMKAYYTLLKNTTGSISQFNHPGSTFGNFSNYAYRDDDIDSRITLLEVGNGEGAIGSGGYFPSYEQYTLALDKGWHIAPSNNQDNHKKGWGTSNAARTVVKAEDNSMENIQEALTNMRVYATEIKDLQIDYTAEGYPMGSVLAASPNEITFEATIENKTDTNVVKSVHLVTNGGITLGEQTFDTDDVEYSFTLQNPATGYYYLMVTVDVSGLEAYAVTAPVWFGQADKFGFTSFSISDAVPVTNLEFDVTTEMFNGDETAVTVTNIKYVDSYGTVIFDEVPSNNSIAPTSGGKDGAFSHTVKYTPTKPGDSFIDVYATVVNNKGAEKTLTNKVEFKVLDEETTNYIGIDGSHYNEYVSGNYKDSMGNFAKLASESDVRVAILNTQEEFLDALSNPKFNTIILTVPTRRLTLEQVGGEYKKYTDTELAALKEFAQSGGTVVLSGWSDYYENYNYSPKEKDMQMSTALNEVSEAIGSHLRISDDAAVDDVNNGGQSQRLYLVDTYNAENPLAEGVVSTQEYSSYGGSTIYVVDDEGLATNELGNVSPLIYGNTTTYSKDSDGDGYGPEGAVPRYGDDQDEGQGVGRVLINASENIIHENGTESLVVASSSAFMSNFEVQTDLDNYSSLPYSNYTIAQNIINTARGEIVISDIADVWSMELGTKVNVSAVVTSEFYVGSSTENKGFFDSIYIQDATGGINVFPVSSDVILGKPVKLSGIVSEYQGEKQIDVSSGAVDAISSASISYVEPKEMSTADTMSSYNTGLLVKTTGIVESVIKDDNIVNQIVINDGTGSATVYINAYITTGVDLSFVTEGRKISVVGFASIGEVFESDDPASRIRVRDRAEIIDLGEDEIEVVDKTLLEEKINEAKECIEEGYTEESWNAFETELEDAIAIFENDEGTAEEVANAIEKLNDAMNNLRADKTELNKLINDVNNLKESDYTKETWSVLMLAYDKASIVNENEVAKVDEVKKAVKLLKDSINDLELVDDETEVIDTTGITAKPYEVVDNNSDDDSTDDITITEKLKIKEIILDDIDEVPLGTSEDEILVLESFKDYKNISSWAKESFEKAIKNGFITGYNGNLNPKGEVTRAEFLTMILKLKRATIIDNYQGIFTDVNEDDWYAGVVETGYILGYINGVGNGRFAPNDVITRQDMAVIINNVLKLEDVEDIELNDKNDIAEYASQGVANVVANGIMKGVGNDTFAPNSIATREMAVVIIINIFEME